MVPNGSSMPIPIFAPYSWEETAHVVIVRSMVNGMTASNTDFFCSPYFVKANCSQPGSPAYLVELDLYAEVDPKKCSAAIGQGEITMRLHKKETGVWGQLLVDVEKQERMKRRQRSISAAEKLQALEADRRKQETWENSRHALNRQMDMDRAQRSRLEDRKTLEKEKEAAGIEAWKRSQLGAESGAPGDAAGHGSDAARPIPSTTTDTGASDASLPPVRPTTTITCTFTPKMTSAPLRTKGVHANYDPEPVALEAPDLGPSRVRTLKSGDLYDISHRDPAWLKDRGDRFYHMRDFAAAANAYTAVLDQFKDKVPAQAVDTFLACLSNRAACHLHAKDFVAAAADAHHAVLLSENSKSISNVPISDEELRIRVRRRRMRLLLRRGTALGHMGLLTAAIDDFQRVLDECPPDDLDSRAQLEGDVAKMLARVHAVDECKALADRIMAGAACEISGAPQGQTEGAFADVEEGRRALAEFDKCLEIAPMHVPSLLNASAAALAVGSLTRCVALCTSVLTVANAAVCEPSPVSVRQRVKALLRRASAKCALEYVPSPLPPRLSRPSCESSLPRSPRFSGIGVPQ